MYCSRRAVLSLFLFLMCCTHLTSQLTVVTSQRHQLLRTQFLLYQSMYLVSPTFSMPTVGKVLPRARLLSSAEFLAQLEEKECQKQLATEQKEQGKKEWVEKKAVRQQMQKQKAEERAEKAGERARKSGCNEREGINQHSGTENAIARKFSGNLPANIYIHNTINGNRKKHQSLLLRRIGSGPGPSSPPSCFLSWHGD